MKKSEIKKCPLFEGIGEDKIGGLLGCLGADERDYQKDEFILRAGEILASVGVVLSGSVHVIREDFWGNRSIIANVGEYGIFGEAFAGAGEKRLPVSVMAAEKSTILSVDYNKIVSVCPASCDFHMLLIKNMLKVISGKNVILTQKIGHLSKRSTREKLLSYLSAVAEQSGNKMIEIPFNRQELADYLCVDRSALSREIAAMCKEGLLAYERNRFTLLRG